jgi:hypothetical protein
MAKVEAVLMMLRVVARARRGRAERDPGCVMDRRHNGRFSLP